MEVHAIPLLHTRLVRPPLRRRSVPRARLFERLADAEAQFILLSAPAGFGKTTLLAAWCHTLAANDQHAVAWLTLEPGDNDPSRFLAYLQAALAAAAAPLSAVPDIAATPFAAAIEPTLTHLLNALEAQQREVLIVLDDYHVIHAPEVHRAVAFVLNHLAPGMRLAISSRADPPLPLARLRAVGRLTELRAADLRFTPAELATFFVQHGVSLPPAELAAAITWLEGWPAGAQLVALALGAPSLVEQGSAPRAISMAALRAGLAESTAHMFSYLADEVFTNQPAHRKTFLLQTSILDQLSGPLCDAVLGIALEPAATDSYSRLILAELEHANLFVAPVDGARHWFRYQQLFRAFLRDRLEREHPHDLAALHQRASVWYAQAHQFGPAIMHALAAGDRDQAAAFIAAVAADTIMRGEYATLRTWLDQLPETSRDQHPELWLWTAWVAFLSGAVEQIEPALERAAQVWPEVQRGQYVGFAAHLRAQLARLRGDASATVAAATEALAALPPDQPAFRAGSELALGVGQLLSGDQHTAANTLHAALNACRLHYQSGVPAALRALGDLERLDGRNVAAMEWYTAALDVDGAQQGWDYWAAQAGLAAIYVAQAEPAVALELLDAALLHAEQAGVAVYMADAYLTLARGLAALGRRADAEAALFQSRRHARRLGAAELLEMIDLEERQWAATQSEVREAHRVRAVGTPVFEPLSERELEVLRLVALGASNQAIADRLVISVGTVKSHLSRILSKLAAQSRTEAVARARALGMLA